MLGLLSSMFVRAGLGELFNSTLGDLCKKASFCPQRCSQMLIYY